MASSKVAGAASISGLRQCLRLLEDGDDLVLGDDAIGACRLHRGFQGWEALDDLIQFFDLFRLRWPVWGVAAAAEQQRQGEGGDLYSQHEKLPFLWVKWSAPGQQPPGSVAASGGVRFRFQLLYDSWLQIQCRGQFVQVRAFAGLVDIDDEQ